MIGRRTCGSGLERRNASNAQVIVCDETFLMGSELCSLIKVMIHFMQQFGSSIPIGCDVGQDLVWSEFILFPF